MTSKTSFDSFIEIADLFRMLSRGFSYPDEQSFFYIQQIANDLESKTLLKDSRELLSKIAEYEDYNAVLADFSRMFIMGRVPVTESACCAKLDATINVASFYNAFGVAPKPGDAPDSIVFELEFVAILLIKAKIAEKEEEREVCIEAYHKFMNEHLIEFSQKFVENLFMVDPTEFYGTLGEIMNQFITNYALERLSIKSKQ